MATETMLRSGTFLSCGSVIRACVFKDSGCLAPNSAAFFHPGNNLKPATSTLKEYLCVFVSVCTLRAVHIGVRRCYTYKV